MSEKTREARREAWVRTAMLEAATRIFAQRHGATRVEEIAEEAGYSTGAIYKYFSNKAELFSAMGLYVGEELLRVYDDTPPVPLPFAARLSWLVARITRLAEARPHLFEVALKHWPMMDLTLREDGVTQMLECWARHRAAMHVVMVEGLASGEVRDGDPAHYADFLLDLIHGACERWVYMGGDPLPEQLDRARLFFLSAVALRS